MQLLFMRTIAREECVKDLEDRIAELTEPSNALGPNTSTPIVVPALPPPGQQAVPGLILTPVSHTVGQLCASLPWPHEIKV